MRWYGAIGAAKTASIRRSTSSFREDASRIQTGDAPQHTGVVRRIALNLLRQELSNGSVKTKRFRSTLNEDYLVRMLEI